MQAQRRVLIKPNPNIGVPLEYVVHQMVCKYIKAKYPNAVFNSDGAGQNQTSKFARGQATMLRSSRGYPDLFLAVPKGTFHGLFLELKRENASVYLKNGTLSTNEHIQEQAEVLQKLVNAGYYADFGIGFDDAIKKIDWYMSLS